MIHLGGEKAEQKDAVSEEIKTQGMKAKGRGDISI